jgi:hypothetical protein
MVEEFFNRKLTVIQAAADAALPLSAPATVSQLRTCAEAAELRRHSVDVGSVVCRPSRLGLYFLGAAAPQRA